MSDKIERLSNLLVRSRFKMHFNPQNLPVNLKRAAGIEPASLAWKAKVLPLNYARNILLTR